MQNVTKGIDYATQGQFNDAKVEFEKAMKEDLYNNRGLHIMMKASTIKPSLISPKL